jgi:hypothetical protein
VILKAEGAADWGTGELTFDYKRWFKYDRDDLCVNKSQFVPVIFEPPCIRGRELSCLQGAWSSCGIFASFYLIGKEI